MARITIEAADIHDLLDTARVLLARNGAAETAQAVPYELLDAPEPESPQAEAPAKRRGRPPKAETTSAPASAPASGSPEPTDAGGPSELEAALMGEAEAPASEVTATDVKAAMQQHIDKFGAGETMVVLQRAGGGATSFKGVAAHLYPAVHAELQAELNA